MKVLENKVVILPNKGKEISDGGIYLPYTEETYAGNVVTTGPGLPDANFPDGIRPMTVKTGDVVVYPKHAGTDMKIGDETYKVMRESEIHLILD